MTLFSDLQLLPALQKALDEHNYQEPTPIQAQAIPTLLSGTDLLGIAQTGTGKTAAFSLPLLQNLMTSNQKRRPGTPRALILVPTRELAVQVHQSLQSYGRHLPLRCTAIFGGVRMHSQTRALQQGVDILVATPGRLSDHLRQQHLTLAGVEILVLDEADRMLDMGFLPEIRNLVQQLPAERQTMLFSATMPAPIAKLTTDLLHNPTRVEVAPESTPVDRIDQRLYMVAKEQKRHLLHSLLTESAVTRSLVFTRTKIGAQRLAQMLQKRGITADAIHGNRTQSARQKALKDFSRGRLQVLVATDVASRGIDVDAVSHVFNYELPDEPESYVHRIGRTARGGAEGIAVSLCAPDERKKLRAIEHTLQQKLAVQEWDRSVVKESGFSQPESAPEFRESRPARPERAARPQPERPRRNNRNHPNFRDSYGPSSYDRPRESSERDGFRGKKRFQSDYEIPRETFYEGPDRKPKKRKPRFAEGADRSGAPQQEARQPAFREERSGRPDEAPRRKKQRVYVPRHQDASARRKPRREQESGNSPQAPKAA